MRRATKNPARSSGTNQGSLLSLLVSAVHVELTDADKELIESLAVRMTRFDSELLACHVTLRKEVSKHHLEYHSATVELRVADESPVVARSADPNHLVALRRAFDAGKRRLQLKLRRRLGPVKEHGFKLDSAEVAPKINLVERRYDLLVEAELPGMEKADIEISMDADAMVIRGERREGENFEEDHIVCWESRCGPFYRNIPLGFKADAETVQAKFRNGMLKIIVPKTKNGVATSARITIA